MTKFLGIIGGDNSVKNAGSLHSRQIFCFKCIVLNKTIDLYCPALFTATRITGTLKYEGKIRQDYYKVQIITVAFTVKVILNFVVLKSRRWLKKSRSPVEFLPNFICLYNYYQVKNSVLLL